MKKNLTAEVNSPNKNNSSEIFRKITETVPGIIALYDITTGQYLYVNKAIKKILGYTPDDFISKGFPFIVSLVHPDDLNFIMEKNNLALEKANKRKNTSLDKEPIVNFEYRMKAKNGTYRWLHTDGSVFSRGADGLVKEVLNVSIDITERKLAEQNEVHFRELAEKLQISEERLRLAMDAGKLGAWDWDIINNKVSWTEKVYNLHGLRPGQFGGSVEDFSKLIHPDDRQKMLSSITKAVSTGGRFHSEFRIILPNKNIRWLFTEGKAITDKSGKSVRMLGATFDITSRKENERKLQISEERFRSLTNFAPVGIFQTDAIGNCLFVNKEWRKIAGLSEQEARGQGWVKALHPEDKDRVASEWYKAAKNKTPFSSIYRFQTPQGKVTWVNGHAIELKDENGKITGYLGSVTDITDQKRLMEQKDEFIGIASHGLKTLVTSIKGYTQVLKYKFEKSGDNESALQLAKMDSQLNKLTNLIGDLLDVTKIEAGKLQFSEEYFSFDELIKEVVDQMQLTTQRHQIALKTNTKKEIFGDRDRIGQVITNLISNAIKYSPHSKKIIVKASLNKENVKLSVQDFGIGMTKTNTDKIFERFFRISGPHNQTFPGLGLGLFISAEIVKRLGGRIWVESIRGKGSTFYFTLPTKKRKINSSIKRIITNEELKHS